MSALNDALGGKGLAWLKIAERCNAGAIHLTPLDAAPEPRNLRRLKTAIRARWGVVPLMDMLTETCLRTGCMSVFTPGRDPEPPGPAGAVRAAPAAGLRLRHRDRDPRGRRWRSPRTPRTTCGTRGASPSRPAGRPPGSSPTPTFAARQAALWGEGTTAVASDSTHFSAFDQNIFTEWHSRYPGPSAVS